MCPVTAFKIYTSTLHIHLEFELNEQTLNMEYVFFRNGFATSQAEPKE